MVLAGNRTIHRKIVAMGIVLILAPLLTLLAAGWIVMQRLSQATVMDGTRTAGANLTHLTQNLFGICRSYHQNLEVKLTSGRTVLASAGAITLDPSQQIVWQARNEASGEITEVSLPLMMAGQERFVPVSDANQRAPVVDEIAQLYGTTATVYQRMSEGGDMLRVSSNEKLDNGKRAIGGYLSAKSAGRQVSQALQAVLGGQTYLGRISVANSAYQAAYQPLKDESGAVVGMLYTAVPEDEIRTQVRQIAAADSHANQQELFILEADGDDRGTALIMGDKSLEGHNLWDEKDSAGQFYVQEICLRAVALTPGEIAEHKYQKASRVGGIPRTVIAQFAYVREWDWVVGFARPEANFLAATPAVQSVAAWGIWLLLGVGLAASGMAIRIWVKFSGDLTNQLSALLLDLTAAVKEIGVLAGAMPAPRSSGEAAAKAGRTAAEISLAIRHIESSSDSVSGVIGALDQMAFATDMLAANAAIEASRSMAGNQGIAHIAEELRQLARRCGEAARATKAAIDQSRSELEKGNEEVTKLLTELQPTERIPPSRRQAEDLLRLAAEIDATLERVSKDLGVERR